VLEREAEDVLFPLALKYGIGVIVRIPLLFGLLSGKFTNESTFGEKDHRKFNLSPEKLAMYLEKFSSYQSVFNTYPSYSPAQLSLRFCISHPACHVVIPGGKTSQQVQENVVASDIEFIPYSEFEK